MNEKLEIIGRTVKKKGKSAVKIIKTETEKIVDEAVNIMDAREKKKVWSGASSIVLKKAPDNIVPGCMVLEGGSFRGCYTSGVLDVFMENGINLQTTIGTSAGALNGYNYVAGEIGRSAKINLNYRHDPRYFSPKTAAQNHGVVGFNFIINEIESEVPFDAERFNDPSRRFLVTVTNCDTAEVVYCEKGKVKDIKKAVQASASMPFVSEMVDVDGMPCLDGGCAVKVPYKWALDNDFEKIVVIRTRTFGYRSVEVDRKMEELAARMYKNNPKLVNLLKYQEEEYNKACDEMEKLHEEGRIFMLCPSGSINISTIEGDMEKLGALYLLGRCDATIALPKVKEYLGIE